MSTSTVIWVIVAIIIIGGLVWYFAVGMPPQAATTPDTQTQTTQNAGGPDYSPGSTGVNASTSVNTGY